MTDESKSAASAGKQITRKLQITYYTDPLCCWSWAFEPQWRRLRYVYAKQVEWRYVLGGMLADWSSYNDPVNAVNRPAQMGPVWTEAKYLSGMPMNDRIWVENPPKSSYPACLAVKAASLQGREAEENYLRKTREAVMTGLMDISDREILLELARQVAEENPGHMDYVRFRKDLTSKHALEALKEDLREVKIQGIARYPSLVIKYEGTRGIIITGYRPYTMVEDAIREIVPDIRPVREIDLADYKMRWNNLTEREIAEVAEGTESVAVADELGNDEEVIRNDSLK